MILPQVATGLAFVGLAWLASFAFYKGARALGF